MDDLALLFRARKAADLIDGVRDIATVPPGRVCASRSHAKSWQRQD